MPFRTGVAPVLTRGLALVVAVVLAAGLTACGSGSGGDLGNGIGAARPSTAPGRVAVVAGEDMWGDILRQIGGDAVSVVSVVNSPDEDPHEYESTLGDTAAVGAAKLVVSNGAGYDDFMSKLLAAEPASGRVELTVADLVHVGGSNPNPHLWYDPGYVLTAARAFEAALARIDPDHAPQFAAGLRRFAAGEQQVVTVLDRIRQKYAGERVGWTERVAGYLVAAGGLHLGTPTGFAQSIEDGTDPSPADNAAFEHAVTSHGVAVLIYNAQVTDVMTAAVKKLAARSHVPVVGMTETLPRGQDFQTWQADQARALLAALGG